LKCIRRKCPKGAAGERKYTELNKRYTVIMTSEEWDCNGFLGSFTENIVLWKHERYLLTPLPTATYIAQG